MPDVYISRAGLDSEAANEKFTQTELIAVTSELANVKQTAKIKDERLTVLEDRLRHMDKQLALLAQALALNPSGEETRSALKRSQITLAGER